MTDKILVYPDPRLRIKADPVIEITPEIAERARGLVRLMNAGNGESTGIGLAATQVGWPVRIMAIKTYMPDGEPVDRVLVNPVLHAVSGIAATGIEGCLSFPGIYVEVLRATKIAVLAEDLKGLKFALDLEGIVARCLQHELDHLDGVLMIDRISSAKKLRIRRQLLELERSVK